MWPNVTNLLKILVLYSLIGQCIASIFLTFGKKSARAEHDYLKSSSKQFELQYLQVVILDISS